MRAKLDKGAKAPTRAHPTDAGVDLLSMETKIINAGMTETFRTGVHVEIPQGMAGLLVSKSGLLTKCGLTSTGLIDEGYDGEIIVALHNGSKKAYCIFAGDKISQLVLIPVSYEDIEIVEEIGSGERGSAGFGSTGR